VIVLAIAEPVEDGEPVLVYDDRLAIDDTGLDGKPRDGVKNQRLAIGEVIAAVRNELDLITVLPRQDAKAVVLDFVNPARTRRRFGFAGETGFKGSDCALDAAVWPSVR
jgi:hypothetical protein